MTFSGEIWKMIWNVYVFQKKSKAGSRLTSVFDPLTMLVFTLYYTICSYKKIWKKYVLMKKIYIVCILFFHLRSIWFWIETMPKYTSGLSHNFILPNGFLSNCEYNEMIEKLISGYSNIQTRIKTRIVFPLKDQVI